MGVTDKWMRGAVPPSHRGIFTKKAKAHGESPMEYARQEYHAKGKTGAEARFAVNAQKRSRKNYQ